MAVQELKLLTYESCVCCHEHMYLNGPFRNFSTSHHLNSGCNAVELMNFLAVVAFIMLQSVLKYRPIRPMTRSSPTIQLIDVPMDVWCNLFDLRKHSEIWDRTHYSINLRHLPRLPSGVPDISSNFIFLAKLGIEWVMYSFLHIRQKGPVLYFNWTDAPLPNKTFVCSSFLNRECQNVNVEVFIVIFPTHV